MTNEDYIKANNNRKLREQALYKYNKIDGLFKRLDENRCSLVFVDSIGSEDTMADSEQIGEFLRMLRRKHELEIELLDAKFEEI